MRIQIKSGNDLIFHLSRHLSDAKYLIGQTILGNIKEKIEDQVDVEVSDPIITSDDGFLMATFVGSEKRDEIKKVVEASLLSLDDKLGGPHNPTPVSKLHDLKG